MLHLEQHSDNCIFSNPLLPATTTTTSTTSSSNNNNTNRRRTASTTSNVKMFQHKLILMVKEKFNCFHRKEFRRKRMLLSYMLTWTTTCTLSSSCPHSSTKRSAFVPWVYMTLLEITLHPFLKHNSAPSKHLSLFMYLITI